MQRRLLRVQINTLLCSLLLLSSSCFAVFREMPSHAIRAETLKSEGKYVEAIAQYRLHLHERLRQRGAEENPYFYLLLIGDCYLALDQSASAEASYVEAERKGVEKGLVAERFRRLAAWHVEREQLEEAIKILREYRALDTLLYDLEIDRLHKESVRREIAEEERQQAEPLQ